MLALLRQEPRRAWMVAEIAGHFGVPEKEVRGHIDSLRIEGHNVRNKQKTGLFWLENGPAPPPAEWPAGGDDRWQGKPPAMPG